METWKQYGVLATALVGAAAAGVYGFFATGGAMPVAKRFHATVEGGASSGGGPLIDLGRGIVTPETVDAMGEFVPILAVFLVFGLAFFAYVTRRQGA